MEFNLKLACGLHEYSNSLPNFDSMELLVAEFKKTCKEEIEIETEDMPYYIKMVRHVIHMGGYYAHNIPITDERFKAFCYLFLWLSVYDDVVDQLSEQTAQLSL